MKLFNDRSFQMLEQALDLRFKRHAVIAGNVANSETPGYKAREYDFAGELQKIMNGNDSELRKTDAQHIDISGSAESHIIFDNSGAVGNDGNNVDLDLSMGKLSSNASAYNNAVSLITMKLRMLRDAATGRSM